MLSDDPLDSIFGEPTPTDESDRFGHSTSDDLFGSVAGQDNDTSPLLSELADVAEMPSDVPEDANLESWIQDAVMPGAPDTGKKDKAKKVKSEKVKREKQPKPPKVAKEPRERTGRAPRFGPHGRKYVAGAAAVVLVSLAAALVFSGGTDEKGQPPATAKPKASSPVISVKDWTATSPPGFADAELTAQSVPATSVAAATEHGVVVVNDKLIAVYHGGQRVSPVMEGNEAVSFVLTTTVNGREALAWRAGDVLNIWNPLSPAEQPIKLALAPGTTVSSAGTGLLFHLNGQTSITNGTGFIAVNKPARAGESEPMAFDGTDVIAADPNGFVWKLGTGASDGQATQVKIQTPGPGLKLSKWVTAGHGHLVSLWRKPGSARVTVVVNSSDTGNIESTHEVDAGAVANETWIRGQSFKLAAFGGLLYDLETGKLVLDGIKQGIVFGRPLGDVAVGTDSTGNLIFERTKTAATAWRNAITLLGLDENGNAVVQSDPATLRFFANPL